MAGRCWSAAEALARGHVLNNLHEAVYVTECIYSRRQYPHRAPAPPTPRGMTVADFLDSYYDRYVVAESLRSAASIRSRLATLKASLGTLPVTFPR